MGTLSQTLRERNGSACVRRTGIDDFPSMWHPLIIMNFSDCGCTVCSGCVRNWNLTLLNDGNGGTGVPTPPKLKCPVCAAPLRKTDAVEVLRRIPSVTLKWDELTRDALLRSMPDFRSCPTCQGGGFTTPECLAPRHTAMVDSAIDVVAQYRLAVLVVYGGFAIGLLRAAPPTYVAAFALTVGIGGRVLARWAALAATRIVTSPLTVECPECSGEYLLQGYGEALSGERDTDQWIHEHTRPCPACGSPIQKAGGCNAMVCGACGSPFCWSCMRAKTACTHFDCANGSPFADKQTTGGRNGQPLTINTPAAHTAALIELANTYGGLALMIAVGAISSAMSNEPSFSTVQWLWKVAVELLIIGAWGLLYLVAAAGIGVIAMVGYRAYGSRPRRGWRGWGR